MKRFWQLTIGTQIVISLLLAQAVVAANIDAIWVMVFSSDHAQVEMGMEKQPVRRKVIPTPKIIQPSPSHSAEETQNFLSWLIAFLLPRR